LTGIIHKLLGFSSFIIFFILLKHMLTSISFVVDRVRQHPSSTTVNKTVLNYFGHHTRHNTVTKTVIAVKFLIGLKLL